MPQEPDREPDKNQQKILDHDRGALLVTGAAGSGKTWTLRERFARLIAAGEDPERIALVVRSRAERQKTRQGLFARLRTSLPNLHVLTVHGLAFHVIGARFAALGYAEPPQILSATDQFARVQDLLASQQVADWPAYGRMLGLRGFADEIRQFLLRAQEALLLPDEIEKRATAEGLGGWNELARFYQQYLDVLAAENQVDFAGLVMQAARAVQDDPSPLFEHMLVDDYQDATFGTEALVVGLGAASFVVAGNIGAHVFSFQGSTDVPLSRFASAVPGTTQVELIDAHRAPEPASLEAWDFLHTSEEYAGVARELRRVHVEDGVEWQDLAVVIRRQGTHVGGLLRSLDNAGIPRALPETGLPLSTEPAAIPYVLALRWLARPGERDGLVESVLSSELAQLSPAAARGLVRAATGDGGSPADALGHSEGLTQDEAGRVESLRDTLVRAGNLASKSVLDAFRVLWRALDYSARLVANAEASPAGRRDLDAVVAFARGITRAGESGDASVDAFLLALEGGEYGAGLASPSQEHQTTAAVQVLTAHGTAGLEFDTVIVAGATEGNFPSLSRPEPMFDLASLDRRISQSERNRLRLEDERRLFRMMLARARRRVLFTVADSASDEKEASTRSRFVDELGVDWSRASSGTAGGFEGAAEPLSVAEAQSAWRRTLADLSAPAAERLASLAGLRALGADPATWWYQRDWTHSGAPLHDTIRTSYSRLDVLENCELQFVLGSELGLGSFSGYHAWVGKLVHKLIEDCENGLVERTLDALCAETDKRWRPSEFPSLAVSEEFRRLVTGRMLPHWMDQYGDTPALGREVGFSFEVDGATITGYIDRIGPILSGGNRITDYKTGKPDNAGPAESNLQLGIYWLAVGQSEELAEFRPVRAVELAFIKGDWRGNFVARKWQPSAKNAVQYEEGMLERVGGLIGRIRELNQTETYRPNPGASCMWCDFKKLCPLYPEGAPVFGFSEPAGANE